MAYEIHIVSKPDEKRTDSYNSKDDFIKELRKNGRILERWNCDTKKWERVLTSPELKKKQC